MNEVSENPHQSALDPYAPVVVRLLGGELYETDKLWADLIEYRIPIGQYFARIGLEVIIDQRDGFAFLRQSELDESGRTIGLIKRTPLSYDAARRELVSNEAGLAYPIRDGVPVLLAEEARRIEGQGSIEPR